MITRSQRPLAGLLAALLWVLHPDLHAAEDLPNWRLFTTREGLAESLSTAVTISPRGNVWIRHGEGSAATWLDGYDAHTVPTPGEGKSPVHESRSGQIWSLTSDGLMEFAQGRWITYPVTEIRAENAANLRRRIHPIPLVPAERDHVFFLIPEGLYKFDASERRAQLIRRAADGQLGPFLDMIETLDGGLLVSAQTGLLRLSGPLRRITPQSPADPLPLPPEWNLSGLDRPIEDAAGAITVSALTTTLPGQRVLARVEAGQWKLITLELERLRQGWRTPDGDFWALSRDRLARFERGQTRTVLLAGTLAGYHNDVAVGTNGSFWIATQDGLLLHSPRSWRTPPQATGLNTPVSALIETPDNSIWFMAADGLHALHETQPRHHPWPADVEPSQQPTDRLLLLPNGRLLAGIGERLLEFEPGPGRFSAPSPPPDFQATRLLGSLRDGSAAVLLRSAAANPAPLLLSRYDGSQWKTLLELPPDWPLSQDIVFLAESVNQDLWIGTGLGLGLWRDGRLQTFGPTQGYTSGRATAWLELGDGRFWCGGVESILEFDGRAWSNVRSGFDRVHSLHKGRDGSIWVASGSGLHRYYRDSWVSASLEEGLPSMAVLSVLEDRRGHIWSGTAFGLSRYHPRTDTDPPRTQLRQSGGEPGIARDGAIRYTVSGIDRWRFTLPSRLLFSYRLDGGPWLPYASDPTLNFQNLPPGRHTLQARAMDRDWNVDPNPVSTEFFAVVPWHRVPSTVAMVFVAGVLALILVWLAINRHLRLARSHAEIERIVEERTQALHRANQELLHSQKMKALGTLAAGVAHDFNQILSIIKGSAQIIETNLDKPDKIRTRAQRIQTVVDQGTGIVRAMLGLSRQDPGQLEPCDVNDLVREVVRLVGDRFLQEVKVRLDVQRGLPNVRASHDLVQQMLLNLAVNAADAMGGRGEIILRTAVVTACPAGMVLEPTPAPRYVTLAVEDRGTGIAPEILPRIFEPFFTTKALSTQRGTGLGLSMVYEFAKEMGAGLRVDSQVATGTTFTIYLPAT